MKLWPLIVFLWCSTAVAESTLEQWISAPSQAISLNPSGGEVLVSYHPGRISMLALVGKAGREFTGIYAVPYRGDFIAHWLNPDELLVAFRPEDACSTDARLIHIALPAVRRAHSAEFRSSRGIAGGGAADLSIHERVNHQLPALLAVWGDLERRRWPGIAAIELPADSCPERWAGNRLQLGVNSTSDRLLYDPINPEILPEPGKAWLFDFAGQRLATLGIDGQLKTASGTSTDLTANPAAVLLGLTAQGDPLLLLETDSAQVFRFKGDQLELFQESTRHPLSRARLAPGSDRVISLDSGGMDSRRVFLDHQLSDVIRRLERETDQSLVLVDATAAYSQMLMASQDSFWLTGPTRVFEAKRAWLKSTAFTAIETRVQLRYSGNLALGQSELAGLAILGVELTGNTVTNRSVPGCRLQRDSHDNKSNTTLTCLGRTHSWAVRLATESDAARARRLQEMVDFAVGKPSVP